MKLSRLKKLLFLHIARLPMPSKKWRPLVYKWGGVKMADYQSVFIGEGVIIDTNRPQNVILEEGVTITTRCIILAHTRDANSNIPKFHTVRLCKNSFLGCNSVICKGVIIGENSLVAAQSVVTKDIPANEVWGGNPARFIKKRVID